MPQIRAVTLAPDSLTLFSILDQKGGVRSLVTASIPAGSLVSAAAVEAYISGTWGPTFLPGCQVRAHVIVLSPLRVTIGIWNLGESIDPNWWSD